ncbi:carbamoyltransferase HypF [Chitinilyticum litopenaei]|uniref:carbamoyltransferase HypF n=1 Tax=Chitinilyticum litopenaei TaxID=1121276 RepID=UPI00041D7017|nr:carbamoyltransferase HypF [Chitinilyticum litopenaei]
MSERLAIRPDGTARMAGVTAAARNQEAIRTPGVADLAPCPDCLAELFDPQSPRWRYAFTHCAQCGPRHTLTAGSPTLRDTTAMRCPVCAARHADPAGRHFEAPALACPHCGPRLDLQLASGASIARDVPGDARLTGYAIAATLALLRHGAIVAIKGVGGFHLCCDARNEQAIARLRARKPRARKPLAIMAANTASLAGECAIDAHESAWLESPERPIVLLRRQPGGTLPASLAPGLASLGVMLPCSPLHYLLFHAAAGNPPGMDWLQAPQAMLLVMTSANASGAPVCISETEAREQLAQVADAFLVHDRLIAERNDDSVLRVRSDGSACFLRRARGYAPIPFTLAAPQANTQRCVLALGAELKTTLCVAGQGLAHVSPHIGDLADARSCRVLAGQAETLPQRLGLRPDLIACDSHPDFYSTRLAQELGQTFSARVLHVQHHHAHIAAVLAEHGHTGPVLGLALDAYGYGSDGKGRNGSWGGELLRVDRQGCQRLGHLALLAQPGADKVTREPWRLAAALLARLGRAGEIPRRFAHADAARVARQLQQMQTLSHTSSLGRLIDAAAALLGVCEMQDYEAEAAQRLESLASPAAPMTDGWQINAAGQLDFLPLFARLADETDVRAGASLLHATLAAGLADWLIASARQQGLATVALAGGCWANRLLDEAAGQILQDAGLTLLRAERMPPGDGAISLGQAWVALQQAG